MEELIFIITGLLGVFVHCCLRANSLITDAKNANINFTVKDYIEKDFLGISVSVAMVFVWLLVFPEVAKVRPNVLIYTRITFFAMGLLGSYIAQIVFTKAKGYIRSVIDKKTNIADNVQAFAETDENGDPIPPKGPKA